MALVRPPKGPPIGLSRWNVVACCQFTWPVMTGISPESKARMADVVAMGIARRVTQRTPHRLTAVNSSTNAVARICTGTAGRYQAWIAVAERIAVRPHVGTQPHQ